MTKHLVAATVAVLAFGLATQNAQAVLAIDLNITGFNTGGIMSTVTDNGAGDLDPTVGAITVTAIGGDLTLNVFSGAGTPVTGPAPPAPNFTIVLNTQPGQLASGVGGTIDVAVSETNLDFGLVGPVDAAGNLSVGGNLSASSSAEVLAFVDDNNGQFTTAPGAGVTQFGPVNLTGITGGSAGGSALVDGLFSLTVQQIITLAPGSIGGSVDTSFSLAVPEPRTIAIAGLFLAGMVVVGARQLRRGLRSEPTLV